MIIIRLFSILLLTPAIYLGFHTLGAILQRWLGRTQNCSPAEGHIAILVPAHNEEIEIEKTLSFLRSAADTNTSIHVVADNCDDSTAIRARDAGAIVWERFHDTMRSKGYALEWAIPRVMEWGDANKSPIAFVAIVDADASLSANSLLLARQAFGRGAEVLQSEYLLNRGQQMRARVASIGFAAMNVVRGLGRLWWSCSDTLKGNGMWFRRELLDKYPWKAYSLAEDFEYAIHLIRRGIRIQILPGSIVTGAPARTGKGLQEQRVRWEAGRMSLLIQTIPSLTLDFIRSPSLLKLDLLFEMITPPLAIVATVYILSLAWEPTRFLLGVPGLFMLSFHVIASIPLAKLPWRTFLDLFAVPFYIFWKLTLLPLVWARRHSKKWVRAER